MGQLNGTTHSVDPYWDWDYHYGIDPKTIQVQSTYYYTISFQTGENTSEIGSWSDPIYIDAKIFYL